MYNVFGLRTRKEVIYVLVFALNIKRLVRRNISFHRRSERKSAKGNLFMQQPIDRLLR